MRWSAVFPLTPVAKGRGRTAVIAGRARVFTPAKTRQAEAALRYFMTQNNPIMFDGAVCLAVDFILLRPKSVSAKKRPHATAGSDLDNYVKQVMDSANGILWKDDKQVVVLMARKMYGESAAVKITVWAKDRQKFAGRSGA